MEQEKISGVRLRRIKKTRNKVEGNNLPRWLERQWDGRLGDAGRWEGSSPHPIHRSSAFRLTNWKCHVEPLPHLFPLVSGKSPQGPSWHKAVVHGPARATWGGQGPQQCGHQPPSLFSLPQACPSPLDLLIWPASPVGSFGSCPS